MSAGEALSRYACDAGLSAGIHPFPRTGTLFDRLSANPFLMAPMAGVSDSGYRLMARAGGAGLAYTEMVSVAGIHYGGDRTWELVIPDESEPDIAVQLFGSDPERFREAAAAVAERLGEKLALIDVNMACPVPKVTRKGEGSALLDDPERAAAIVKACREAAEKPVTVKIRSGRTAARIVAPEFARAMEQAGASAIAVHGRTASQLYHGMANWDVISQVANAVSVPVIGSGDALTAEAASRLVSDTGATAAFVARGTYGNPWIFSDALALLSGEELPDGRDAHRRLAAFRLHVRLLAATHANLARARSLAGWYLKGMPRASTWRDRAMRCLSEDDYLELADAVEAALEGE